MRILYELSWLPSEQRYQNIRISYDSVGFIHVEEQLKQKMT